MTSRDLQLNWLFVFGFVSLVLGLGNWAVGASESSTYQKILHRTAQTGLEESYRSFRERMIRKTKRCFVESTTIGKSTMVLE